jgi:DNA-binding NtrC family response regulator
VRLESNTAYTVGRDPQVDLRFEVDAVSRLHAHLKHVDGAWRIVDAGSANGTYLANGGDPSDARGRSRLYAEAQPLQPGQPCVLEVGDVVFLGDAEAALVAVERAPVAPEPTRTLGTRGQRYLADLGSASRAQGPVLLLGPSGSGKTWAARRIHDQSGRRGRFLSLNAAALPNDPVQLRSVFLGHTKGAFTGATHDVEGVWAAAAHGTLFLDEVDSLAPPAQAFLLTLLEQSGDLTALGQASGAGPQKPLDVRVITASKTSLRQAQLRQDLAFRLVDGSIVEVPSLAERREDIPALVHSLVDDIQREDGAAVPFSAAALEACQAAPWPGEVRQLRGAVRALCRGARDEGRAVVRAEDVASRLAVLDRALGLEAPRADPLDESVAGLPDKKPRALTREDVERALVACAGNMQHAAQRLGIARNTLLSKMDAFGIPRPRRG